MDLRNGNCLELMKTLPDKSVDLMICDLPYGETNCKWDIKIDMEEFWKQYKRIRKHDRVACIHFCSTKFGYTLIKSWEEGFKMDMVWKKRNKTGGLCSRYRPMRNHEMVYFFYDKCPKYNRDKYHKRIVPTPKMEKSKTAIMGKEPVCKVNFGTGKNFDPPNPASVINEDEKTVFGIDKDKAQNSGRKDFKGIGTQNNFEPPNPASVLEETNYMGKTEKQVLNSRSENGKKHLATFDPPNPASVINEVEDKVYGNACGGKVKDMDMNGKKRYEPLLPASVLNEVEDKDIATKDEPKTMYESTKVFIGKRHHQTEKPQDILEFFIKYWTDEGQTILDPTMGSGSTGVACKELKRNFVGFELDPKIYQTALKRING